MKKFSKILIAIALMIVTFLISNNVLAETIEPARTFTTHDNDNGRSSGYYRVPTDTGATSAPVIKVVEDGVVNTNSVYCFKAGVGFGGGTVGIPVQYTQSMSLLQSRDSFATKYGSYVEVIPSTRANYNSAVGLLMVFADTRKLDADEIKNSVNAMIEKVAPGSGLNYDTFQGYSSIGRTGYKEDIIEVVQQSALWYFTNPEGRYHPVEIDAQNGIGPSFKWSASGGNASIVTLSSKYNGPTFDYENLYLDPAEFLFAKLLDYGKNKANTDPSNPSESSGSTFNKSDRNVVDLENGYSLVGPYTFTLSDTDVLTSATINVTDYKMYRSDETEVSGSTFKDKLLAVNGQQFYLRVPNSVAGTNLRIDINTTRTIKEINCLTVASALGTNQPLVEYKSTPKTVSFYDTVPVIKTRKFDLALRKYITRINDTDITDRVPQVTAQEINNLYNENGYFTSDKDPKTAKTTAKKEHKKTPLEVKTGDRVVYTIRIYNEGNVDGYCTEITDYLPDGLILTPNSETNGNKWTTEADGERVKVKTTQLANTKINALTNTVLDSKSVQIECTVTAEYTDSQRSLINVAEITSAKDVYNGTNDRDSDPYNLTDDQKSRYEPGTSTNGKGYEDDDDYEPLYLPAKHFDLALRKFITNIKKEDGTNVAIDSRVPNTTDTDYAAFKNENPDPTKTHDQGTTAYKRHTKDPLLVETGDTVSYTIRIYNEGSVDGYATIVSDYLPEGLALKSGSRTNEDYGWTGTGREVSTNYLREKKIDAFNGTKFDYEDLLIECVVTAVNDGDQVVNLKNVAQITAASNVLELIDRDSTPGNLTNDQKTNYQVETSPYGKGYEDDDDYEELYLKPVKFDLALRKYIVSVKDANGNVKKSNVRELNNIDKSKLTTGTTADYIHKKDPIEVEPGDLVTYRIATYNEGDVRGFVYSIKDYLPNALEFIPGDEFVSEEELSRYIVEARYKDVSELTDEQKALKTKVESALYVYEFDEENNAIIISDADHARYMPAGPYSSLFWLEPFNGTTLDSKYIELTCRVKENFLPTKDTYLTNVATMAYGSKGGSTAEQPIPDRDSSDETFTVPTQEQLVSENPTAYKGNSSNPNELNRTNTHYKGQEDDDDFEKLVVRKGVFDLALRKFITKVDGKEVAESREPDITQEYLRALATRDSTKAFDNGTTSYKKHTKDPIQVKTGQTVIYTIRVYNEGSIDGWAKEIVDHLPVGLKYKEDSELNKQYGWTVNGQEIKTRYLENTLIKALSEKDGKYTIDYKDVEVECTIEAQPGAKKLSLKNVAEITESHNEYGHEDRDSEEDNITKGQRDDYKPKTSRDGKGYEDDDDYEELELVRFDLALRKFITKVNNEEIKSRIPEVDTSKFGTVVDGKEVTTCEYNHPKDAVLVGNTDVVVYTIRIYNEGNIDGYCESVKDDIPQGLTYLPDHEVNKKYGWTLLDKDGKATTKVADAKYVITDYLKDSLIKAFDKDTMKSPDYKDVQVAFKVDEPTLATPKSRELINHAQIRKSLPDIDSTPDEWIEGEDDQDIEKLRVLYFDLSLRKWVTHAIVIEDGKKKVMETGHKAEDDPESIVKVELNHDRLKNTVVKFQYSIRIKNEGEIEGYCTEISDYIPEGLKFVAEDNKGWKEVDGKVVTDQLKDKLLKPGETAEVTITLTWVNNENNMGVKVNTAEISKDKNKYDAPDIDSTPDNRKAGEDDIDDAPVALVVMTGGEQSAVLIGISALAVVGAGIVLIKKYVI